MTMGTRGDPERLGLRTTAVRGWPVICGGCDRAAVRACMGGCGGVEEGSRLIRNCGRRVGPALLAAC